MSKKKNEGLSHKKRESSIPKGKKGQFHDERIGWHADWCYITDKEGNFNAVFVIQSRVSGCLLAYGWTTNNTAMTSAFIAGIIRGCVSKNDTAHPEFLHVNKHKAYDGLPLQECLDEFNITLSQGKGPFSNNPSENTMNRLQINVGVQFFKLKNVDSKAVSEEFPQYKKKSYYERARKKEVRTAIAGKESFKSNFGDLLSKALEEINDGLYNVSLGNLVGSRRKAD